MSTRGQDAKGPPATLTEEELSEIGNHLSELRQWASGQRMLRWSLGIGFAIGLAGQLSGLSG